MKEGLKKALSIIDGLSQKYMDKLHSAKEIEDSKAITHWQAYLSSLSVAAFEIEKELKKIGGRGGTAA